MIIDRIMAAQGGMRIIEINMWLNLNGHELCKII